MEVVNNNTEGEKVHFYIPADQLAVFDKQWKAEGLDNRSAAIRQLIREYLARTQEAKKDGRHAK